MEAPLGVPETYGLVNRMWRACLVLASSEKEGGNASDMVALLKRRYYRHNRHTLTIVTNEKTPEILDITPREIT
jgi:hypothetical protein